MIRARRILAAAFIAATLLFAVSTVPASASTQCSRLAGPWYVDTIGAPFHAHLFVFQSGIVTTTNPDAAEALNSSSAGVGAYRGCTGQFLEVNADKLTNRYTSTLVVRFRVATVDSRRFTAPATATYYDGDGNLINGPFDAVLNGQRITADSPPPVVAP